MNAHQTFGYRTLILSWLYGLVCGLGIAATAVGILRGEALPGVIWPALVPLMCGPLLIMSILGRKQHRAA